MFPNNTPEAVNRTKNLNGPLKQLLHRIRGSKNMRGRFSRIWKHIMKLNMKGQLDEVCESYHNASN